MTKSSGYSRFISSEEWSLKRFQVIQRDGGRCRTCHSREDLEVHHVVYPRARTFQALERQSNRYLITLCHWCHQAIHDSINSRKNLRKSYKVEDVKPPQQRVEIIHDKKILELQDHRSVANHPPQWSDRRSHEQVCKSSEVNILKEEQD